MSSQRIERTLSERILSQLQCLMQSC